METKNSGSNVNILDVFAAEEQKVVRYRDSIMGLVNEMASDGRVSRPRSIALTKLQEAAMWLKEEIPEIA